MLNRRSFLKACGVGVVAPSLVALGGTTVVPEATQTCGCPHDPKCTPLMELLNKRRAEMDAMLKAEFDKRFWKSTTNEELNAKGLGFDGQYFTDSDDNLCYEFTFRKRLNHG